MVCCLLFVDIGLDTHAFIIQTINPLLFRSNNQKGRKTNENPFAPAFSHENHDNNNDNKFGLEKMFVGDNTKSRAALFTPIPNLTAIKVPIMASIFWRKLFNFYKKKKDIIKNCRHFLLMLIITCYYLFYVNYYNNFRELRSLSKSAVHLEEVVDRKENKRRSYPGLQETRQTHDLAASSMPQFILYFL